MKIYSNNQPKLMTKQFNFTNNHLENDIDFALIYDIDFGQNAIKHLETFNIPIIGGSRLNKIYQNIVLERFNIKTPKIYFNTKTFEPFKSIEEFDSFCDLKEFVVKPITGARGIGIKTIDRKAFKEMLENPNTVAKIFSKELEAQRSYADDISHDYVESQFRYGDMLVQELVKVNREFRLLCFPNDVLVYERKKQTDQFLGNLSHGSTPISMNENDINNIDPNIINKIKTLMKKFKYPWLSVDLYTDNSSEMGVFEFQMEFAYEGFNPTLVRDAMENSLKTFVKNC